MGDVEQSAVVPGTGNLVIQAGRDVNLAAGPKLYLTTYESRRGRIDSDADMLTAQARAIEMFGRAAEMRGLGRWLRNDRAITVRVLTGTAGTGKTRLALELVDEAIGHDWDAGFVTDRELVRFAAQANLAAWGWQNPTLIVVDYAAARARQLGTWLAELADNDSATPLRLLLLERHADPDAGWWREALGRGGGEARARRALLDPAAPVAVPPLVDIEVRRRILAVILTRVSSDVRPPEPGENPEFDARLARVSWGGEPLFLQMAGVLAAETGFGHVLTLSRADLAFELADREIARIEGIAKANGMEPAKDFVVHMAAYATLCQGLTREAALPAIAAEKRALMRDAAGDPPEIFKVLVTALPSESDKVAPVLPDMIGEALLLRSEIDANTVMRASETSPSLVAATVMRAAQDYAPHNEFAPLDWLDSLVESGAADIVALMEIANTLPTHTLVLRGKAVELHGQIAKLAEQMADDGPTGQRRQVLATTLNNLAIRLSEVGKREEALEVAREALSLRRDPAAANPDSFTPNLATSLNNLATMLSEVGKREEALDVAREAVSLRRDLAVANPDAFTPDLAVSLNNLATMLSQVGKREEALEVAREALSLRRDPAAANPDAFTPDLAMSLNNLAATFSQVGKREEALEVAREAVSLYRDLVDANPDAFTPGLATSLNNLANMLSEVGKREEALDVAREAVSLRRDLAVANPDAFTPDLAVSLNNLATMLSQVGKREEALEVAREALSLRRDPAAANPWDCPGFVDGYGIAQRGGLWCFLS